MKLERIQEFRRLLKISGASSVYRRYFLMNCFDGAMTSLGIVIGVSTSQLVDPRLVLGAGLGASMAMAVSGFFGAYMAERAERRRTLRRLSRAMLHNLDNSVHARAMKAAAFWTALVDALSPSLPALLSMMPFLLAISGVVGVRVAVLISVSIILLILFFLGLLIGRISRENLITSGLRTLALGVLTSLVLLAIGFLQS